MSDSQQEQDNTTSNKQQELQRLLSELNASIAPLTKAVRQSLQGHDVDVSAARHEAIEKLDDVIEQVSPSTKYGTLSYSPAELVAAYWDRISQRREFASTGFSQLNKVLNGGFEQDRLAVLLGAPGSGKTTFTNHMADHMTSIKRPVLYVTSEDTPHTLLAKTIARRGQIDYSAVLGGYQSERAQITSVLQEYAGLTQSRFLRYVDTTQGITLDEIYRQAQRHFKSLEAESSGAPILIVDYLQRLSRGENLGIDARQSATIFTERLRAMACDLHCTVICLSAMNRSSRYETDNSAIGAAKESGDIEYTADIIMAIGDQANAPEPSPGRRRYLLRVDKNRQGATTYNEAHIYLDWYGVRQHFTEADQSDNSAGAYASNGRSNGRRGGR